MFEITFEGRRYTLRHGRWTGGKKGVRELFEIAAQDVKREIANSYDPYPDGTIIKRLRALKVPFKIVKETAPKFVEGRIYSPPPSK